jgi:rubrerythrin
VSDPFAGGLSRREAVRRGVAVGGAAITAAMLPELLGAGDALAQSEDTSATDSEILVGAIGIEQTAVLTYETAAAGGLLGPGAGVARLFAAQEQQHADALIAALRGIGGKPPPPPRIEDVPGLTEVKTGEEMLRFAVELENMAIAAYLEAHKRLGSAALLKTATEIVANEGQHLVVLRQALGDDPIPSALPTGSEHA